MHTSNRSSGTKKITEATAAMNLNSSTTVSLPTTTNTKTATATGGGEEEQEGGGGGGGKFYVGSGENIPNNNMSRNKRVGGPELAEEIRNPTQQDRDRRSANAVAKLSSTEKDDDNHNDDNTENTTEKNTHTKKKNEAAADCGQRIVLGNSNSYEPSSSSSVKTLSEVVEAELTAAEIRREREKCPICFHVLPRSEEVEYKSCCGRKICYGCSVGRERAGLREPGKIIEGETLGEDWFAPLSEKEEFILIRHHWSNVCPFCRHKGANSDEERLQSLYDRIEKRNQRDYTTALTMLGHAYGLGLYGLPKNIKRAEELLQEANGLGDPIATYKLYQLYKLHYPNQFSKQMEFLQRGETLGNLGCIENLAKLAIVADEYKDATQLLMKVAWLGGDSRNLIICYRNEYMSKEDFATTLRAHQAANDELKTERRGFAMRYKAFVEGN